MIILRTQAQLYSCNWDVNVIYFNFFNFISSFYLHTLSYPWVTTHSALIQIITAPHLVCRMSLQSCKHLYSNVLHNRSYCAIHVIVWVTCTSSSQCWQKTSWEKLIKYDFNSRVHYSEAGCAETWHEAQKIQQHLKHSCCVFPHSIYL